MNKLEKLGAKKYAGASKVRIDMVVELIILYVGFDSETTKFYLVLIKY